MKKNIFDPAVKQQILQRIDSLTHESKARWGKMNVRQGLHHMGLTFRNAAGELPVKIQKGSALKKKIMKFFLLNAPIPKGKAETLPEFNTVTNGVDPQDFALEQSNLKASIERFFASKSLAPESASGGEFTREDWGMLMYRHTDHHLKQFGA